MLCPLLLTTQAFAQEAETLDGPEYTWEDETDPLVAGSHHGMRVIEVCEKVIEVDWSVYEDGEDYSTVDIEIFVDDYSLPLGYDDWDFLSIGLCGPDSDADQPYITIADIAVQSFIDWIDANYDDVVPVKQFCEKAIEDLVGRGTVTYNNASDTMSIAEYDACEDEILTFGSDQPQSPTNIHTWPWVWGNDLNRDGVVNIQDIQALVNVLCGSNPKDLGRYDTNGDGRVDEDDIKPIVIEIMPPGNP